MSRCLFRLYAAGKTVRKVCIFAAVYDAVILRSHLAERGTCGLSIDDGVWAKNRRVEKIEIHRLILADAWYADPRSK
jgi:hypothetical protein